MRVVNLEKPEFYNSQEKMTVSFSIQDRATGLDQPPLSSRSCQQTA